MGLLAFPENTEIQSNKNKAVIDKYPSSAKIFLKNSQNQATGAVDKNVLIHTDLNMFTNNKKDEFSDESNGCSESSNAQLFCNIFDMGIKYVLRKN